MKKYEYFSKWRKQWIEFKAKPTKEEFLSYKAHFYQMREINTNEPLTIEAYAEL